MAKNKRTEIQIEQDKQLILENLLQGYKSKRELADLINARYKKQKIDIKLSEEQIRLDSLSVLEDMRKDREDASKKALALAERRILYIYTLAYREWEESKKIKTKTMRKEKDSPYDPSKSFTEENISKEKQYGDPRFLAIMESCVDKIAKLNALYVPDEEEENTEAKSKIKVIMIPDNSRTINQ